MIALRHVQQRQHGRVRHTGRDLFLEKFLRLHHLDGEVAVQGRQPIHNPRLGCPRQRFRFVDLFPQIKDEFEETHRLVFSRCHASVAGSLDRCNDRPVRDVRCQPVGKYLSCRSIGFFKGLCDRLVETDASAHR